MTENNDRALGRVEGKIDLMIENNNWLLTIKTKPMLVASNYMWQLNL